MYTATKFAILCMKWTPLLGPVAVEKQMGTVQCFMIPVEYSVIMALIE